ncbi:uncharacterized protein LOC141627875 [Silene latifolia]|uniref:uncharacterized protein LOC141627875 n=1 Tax=Silene latifolia TaxID=37657 RepID=UPI003D77A539
MAGDDASDDHPKIDSLSPYYLGSHDVPGAKISNVTLRRDNYDAWQKSMTFSLKSRRKFGFVDGTIKKPSTEFELDNWVVVNCTIVQWIRNMIDPSLLENISYPDEYLPFMVEIKEQYSVIDGTMIHGLKTQLNNCKQAKGMDVTTYFGKLKTLWDSLARHEPPFSCQCGKCVCGIGAKAMQRQDNERLHQFFMGLDPTLYGNIRSSQFQLDPLPSLTRAYNLVLQEERLRVETQPNTSDVAIFTTPSANTDWRVLRDKERTDKLKLPRTIAEYLVYRARAAARGPGTAQSGTSGGSNTSKAGSDPSVRANEVITHPSAHSLLDTDRLSGMCEWIIDTGASNHVTGTLSCLEDQIQIPGRTVGLPNGQQVVASVMGSVYINDFLTLRNVLFVPALTCNLISVSQLTIENTFSFEFTKNTCLIQDPSSRKTIGAGELRDGLFWIHAGERPLTVHTVTGQGSFDLWHRRLGHPSDKVVKTIPSFSNLSCNKDIVCDACHLAKQHRDSFISNNKRASDLFELIRCDLWGLIGSYFYYLFSIF